MRPGLGLAARFSKNGVVAEEDARSSPLQGFEPIERCEHGLAVMHISRQSALTQCLTEVAGIGREHDIAAIEPYPQRLVPRRVAMCRQAQYGAIAEDVVFAIDQTQFVAKVEVARIVAMARGGVGRGWLPRQRASAFRRRLPGGQLDAGEIPDSGRGRIAPPPGWRFAVLAGVFPRAGAEIVPRCRDVAGLRGTGSFDRTVPAVFFARAADDGLRRGCAGQPGGSPAGDHRRLAERGLGGATPLRGDHRRRVRRHRRADRRGGGEDAAQAGEVVGGVPAGPARGGGDGA